MNRSYTRCFSKVKIKNENYRRDSGVRDIGIHLQSAQEWVLVTFRRRLNIGRRFILKRKDLLMDTMEYMVGCAICQGDDGTGVLGEQGMEERQSGLSRVGPLLIRHVCQEG